MCGIGGIIGNNISGELTGELESMMEIVAHRGPDGKGYYHDAKFVLGHRRLSILDLSELGAQPMEYMNRYVITYNGEIYNYIELREELKAKGYSFKSDTDTEVVIAAYDFWKEDCLNHFNGMWAFALYDKAKQVVFCARDRFGIKPFYYTQIGNKFVFASEIKQFTVIKGWKALGNIPRIMDFLYEGVSDHTNETLFKNVYQLRGGESLLYDLHKAEFKVSGWYNLKRKSSCTATLTPKEAKNRFFSLFEDAVRLRLRSDVKVGSCLSGGLDSSAIVCVANNLLRKTGDHVNQETVSSCFEQKKYDEQEYIDTVIEKTGVKGHKVFPSLSDLLEELDRLTWFQDEPFGSTSIFAQWNVFKTARENNILVMLDGQGADEQLAGYSRFHAVYFTELFLTGYWKELKESLENYRKCYSRYYHNPFKMIATAIMQTPRNRTLYEWTLKTRRMFKKDVNDDFTWLHQEIRKKHRFNIPTGLTVKDESVTELLYTSLPMLLHYEDRDSMAHSVESRVPFMDYRLVEFVLSLPNHYKIHKAVTKYVLRNAMQHILPDKIINRYDKLGFVTPEEVWIRENTAFFRKELCDACDTLAFLVNKACVLRWFDRTVDSSAEFNYAFWKLISLSRWIKVFKIKFR